MNSLNTLPPTSCSLLQICRRYSRLPAQTLLVAIDAIFLAGKISPMLVPPLVTRSAFLALNGVGLVFIPYSADLLCKVVSDAYHGKKSGTYLIAILASLKALEILSNTGLILAGFIAAGAGLYNKEKEQKIIYDSMIPIGEATLLLGIALSIFYVIVNYRVLKQLNVLLPKELKQEEGLELLDFQDESLKPSEEPLDSFLNEILGQGLQDTSLGCQVKACMDKDTFYHFQKQIQAIPHDDLDAQKVVWQVIRKNIATQQVNFGGQLILDPLGRLLMGIEKYFPNTIISASINTGVASAYLFKYLIETLLEVRQRRRLTQVAEDSILKTNSLL